METLRRILAEHRAALRTRVAWEGLLIGASIAYLIACLMGIYPIR